jgi:hypothetical protein
MLRIAIDDKRKIISTGRMNKRFVVTPLHWT